MNPIAIPDKTTIRINENGIFENGDFKGKFISGIKLTDISKN